VRRILILDHPQFTSATYYLWYGLKELEEFYPNELEVEVYPYTPAHYCENQYDLNLCAWFLDLKDQVDYWKKHPQDLPYGIPPFQADETLTALDVTQIERGIKHRNFRWRHQLDLEERVVELLDAGYYDLVVLGNSHRIPTISLSLLKAKVKKMPPLVYLDAGERDELNEHWIHVFRPELIFKQILTPEVKTKGMSVPIPGYTPRFYPLPLSSPVVDYPGEVNHVPIQWLLEERGGSRSRSRGWASRCAGLAGTRIATGTSRRSAPLSSATGRWGASIPTRSRIGRPRSSTRTRIT